MKRIKVENYEYDIIEDNGDCFDLETFKEKYTDYFYEYDYILGDYAYNKLRLKGFCDKNNKRHNKINDIKNFTWRRNLCYFYSVCQYMFRIQNIHDYISSIPINLDVIDYFDNVNNVRTKSQGLQKARNNQKSYGTLGEHWYELMRLFEIKDFYCLNWKNYFNEVIEIIKENKEDKVRFNSSAKNTYYIVIKVIADSLGIEFIEDFVKACEKCEE